jgi:hypothetical protein
MMVYLVIKTENFFTGHSYTLPPEYDKAYNNKANVILRRYSNWN